MLFRATLARRVRRDLSASILTACCHNESRGRVRGRGRDGVGSGPLPPVLFSFNATQRAADAFKGRLKCRDPWQFVYRPAFSFLPCPRFPFFFLRLLLLLHPCLLLHVYAGSATMYSEPDRIEERFLRRQNFICACV